MANIEKVTPEMIEAGKRTFESFVHPDNYEPLAFTEDIVTEIYLAMKALIQPSTEEPDEQQHTLHN